MATDTDDNPFPANDARSRAVIGMDQYFRALTEKVALPSHL